MPPPLTHLERGAPSLGLPPERQEPEDVAQEGEGNLASLLGKYSVTSGLKVTSGLVGIAGHRGLDFQRYFGD